MYTSQAKGVYGSRKPLTPPTHSSHSPSPLSPHSSPTHPSPFNHTPSNATSDKDSYKGSMYDFTDPKRIGPGAWTFMHNVATWADGDKLKEEHACQIFEHFCENFKCGDCSGHCIHHITVDDPPRKYIGIPGGLFTWTVNFRNVVQKRLGRTNLYDLETMRQIFSDKTFYACSEGCGEQPSNPPLPSPQQVTAIPSRHPGIVNIYGAGSRLNELSSAIPKVIEPHYQVAITGKR